MYVCVPGNCCLVNLSEWDKVHTPVLSSTLYTSTEPLQEEREREGERERQREREREREREKRHTCKSTYNVSYPVTVSNLTLPCQRREACICSWSPSTLPDSGPWSTLPAVSAAHNVLTWQLWKPLARQTELERILEVRENRWCPWHRHCSPRQVAELWARVCVCVCVCVCECMCV